MKWSDFQDTAERLAQGSTEGDWRSAIGCSAMLNIIGQLPEPENILSVPGAHLHTYGKSPRAGRN